MKFRLLTVIKISFILWCETSKLTKRVSRKAQEFTKRHLHKVLNMFLPLKMRNKKCCTRSVNIGIGEKSKDHFSIHSVNFWVQ